MPKKDKHSFLEKWHGPELAVRIYVNKLHDIQVYIKITQQAAAFGILIPKPCGVQITQTQVCNTTL